MSVIVGLLVTMVAAAVSTGMGQSTVALERKAASTHSRTPLDRPARLLVTNVPIATALDRLAEASGVPLGTGNK